MTSRTLSVAPMMDWTDRHCRFFHRLLAPGALLYTEMVTTGAIIHGDRSRLLAYDPVEHPLALQIGGSDPVDLARCARIGADLGFDEINLNVGCPSDRVQSGRFGACLMREPDLVADCVAAMRAAVDVEVTVKHRIGVDDQDTDVDLERFVTTVAQAGCRKFIVHARKAWLSGLSPRENRDVPPLDYARVYRMATDHPKLRVIINGGITAAGQCHDHLARVDGVMLGRAAYQNPWLLCQVQHEILGGPSPLSRAGYVQLWRSRVEQELARGTPLKHMTRHVLGLFQSQPGARRWRQVLSQRSHLAGADWQVVADALAAVEAAQRPTTETA